MYNSTNATTSQDMMGGGGNNAPMGQTLGQLGLFGFGGQQDGYGGYGGQQGGYGPFGSGYGDQQQGMGQIPGFASPYFQQMRQQPQSEQGMGQTPGFANQYFQQMQRQPQSQQLNQLNQMMRGQPDSQFKNAEFKNAAPERAANRSLAKNNAQTQSRPVAAVMPQQSTSNNKLTPELAQSLMQKSMTKSGVPTSEFNKYGGYDVVSEMYADNKDKLNAAQQRTADINRSMKRMTELTERNAKQERERREAARLARRTPAPAPAPVQAPTDFSKMSQAGQFGDQGFAQTLRDFAGQQYKDYAYNPGDQTFYKGGDKASQGVGLGQVLQQGRAAGYKMANGGIAALRRKGK